MAFRTLDDSQMRARLGGLHDRDTVRVLHVDDDADFAELVGIYLEREGDALEVVTEHDAGGALDRLDSGRIDCVVSDYDMPGRDGLEFLGAVREEHPDLPFVLFTGKGSEAIASEAISAGVTDYLQKGSGTEQYTVLANRIENTVERRRVEREVDRGFEAIETAREGIAFLDEEGTFRYVNGAYADIYGYDRDELVGEHWEVLYPDERVDRVYEEVRSAMSEEDQWTGESVHVHADGTRLLVDHALAYTERGMLLCLVRDITEEKETERALERERRRFELFVDAVEEYAVVSLDPDGFVTSWNSGAERIMGYDGSEIVGEHVSTFYPEERAAAGYPDDLLAEAVETGTAEDEGWRVRADGSEFWADATVTAVFDDDGRHRGFLTVTRDATDGRAAQAEGERVFLEEALDLLDDVFYVLDGDGEIVRVTDRATEVTGYDREELLSMSPADLFDADDRERVRDGLKAAFETGSETVEADVVTKDGRTIPYEFRNRRLADDEGEVFLAGMGRDVSERERRERQLERQSAQFDHFGSVLAHDLRTPLTAAQGRLELARETDDPDHLRAAADALDRLEELIDDLSDVMREGELVRDVTAVPLGPALRSVWDVLDTGEASLVIADDATVGADEEALKRLVENLFVNALDHAGPDVTVTVGALPDGFYVEDDGPGIPDADHEQVFEAGYSTSEGGSGFGLASARQLVLAHGWTIAATEGSDGGARFEITDVDTPEASPSAADG